MRVIFLNGFVGANHSYRAKDEAEIKDDEALRLIEAGIAKPKNKKEYEKLKKESLALKEKKEQLQMEAYATLKQKELKASALEYAESLKSTLEMIQDEEFTSRLDLNSLNKKTEKFDLFMLQIVEEINTLSIDELRSKYQVEAKEE